MKALPGFAFSIVAIVLLCGCAGTRGMTSTRPAQWEDLTPEQQYVAYVERIAKRRGVTLMWVNPPRIAGKPENP